MRGDRARSLLFILFAFALIKNLVTFPDSASTKTLFSCGAGDHRQLVSSNMVVVLCYLTKVLSIFPAWCEATAPAVLTAPDGLSWLVLWVGFPC